MTSEQASLARIALLPEEELRVALLLQAFFPVSGWEQFDTGDFAYSLILEGGKEETAPIVVIRTDGLHDYWRWYLLSPGGTQTIAENKYYQLAYDAMVDAKRALQKHFPGITL